MQTIYLDISSKGVVPTVYAKQNDVGRKFAVILTDSGLPYIPEIGSVFSVWYKGASGEGNYTDIGNKSAFSLNGNKVEVEMIVQMLSAHGDGILCLTLNSPDGNQISSWNIPYMCEMVPGSESEKAEEYYTAFSKAVEELPYPDETLSISGKAADSAAVGKSLAKKADISYTKKICNPHNLLDNSDFRNPVNQRGATEYIGTNAYAIDRWYVGGVNNKVTVGNGSVKSETTSGSSYATIAQKVANCRQYAGKTLTFAACVRSNVTPRIYAFNGNAGIKSVEGVSGDYQVLVCVFTVLSNIAEGALNVRIQSKSTTAGDYVEAKWTALYEGEYTTETLPAYQPKGYAAELLECQRYYLKLLDQANGFASGATTALIPVSTPVQMRATPTVSGTVNWLRTEGTQLAASNTANAAFSASAPAGNGVAIALSGVTGLTQHKAIYIAISNFALSADL